MNGKVDDHECTCDQMEWPCDRHDTRGGSADADALIEWREQFGVRIMQVMLYGHDGAMFGDRVVCVACFENTQGVSGLVEAELRRFGVSPFPDPSAVPPWVQLREQAKPTSVEELPRSTPGLLREALEQVRALHRPMPIYDECDCPDDAKDDGRHVDIGELGFTCEVKYVACSECCSLRPWGEISEDCADKHHRHSLDENDRCPTVRLLASMDTPAPDGAPQ